MLFDCAAFYPKPQEAVALRVREFKRAAAVEVSTRTPWLCLTLYLSSASAQSCSRSTRIQRPGAKLMKDRGATQFLNRIPLRLLVMAVAILSPRPDTTEL